MTAIRPALPEDAEALARLIEPLLPSFWAEPDGAGAEAFQHQVSAATLRGRIEDPEYRFWVAEDTRGLAGVVAMRGPCHLFHLYVAADRHRQGLGTLLWAHARLDALRRHRCTAFTLNSSLEARSFYQRHGFRAVGELQRRDGIAFQPMRLELPEHAP